MTWQYADVSHVENGRRDSRFGLITWYSHEATRYSVGLAVLRGIVTERHVIVSAYHLSDLSTKVGAANMVTII